MQKRTSQLVHCAAGAFAFLIALPLKWLTIETASNPPPSWVPESVSVTGLTGFLGVNSLHIPLWTLLVASVLATAGVASNAAGLTSIPKFFAVTLLMLNGLCYLLMFLLAFAGHNIPSIGPIIALLGTIVVVWIGLERN